MTLKIFSHHISWMYLGLFVVELLIFFLSMYYADSIRFMYTSNWYAREYVLFTSIFYMVTLSCATFALGLYRRNQSWNTRELLIKVGISYVAILCFESFLLLFIPDFTISKSVLAIALLSSFLGMMCSRLLFYKLTRRNILEKKILVVGVGENAQSVICSNDGYVHRGFQIVGCVSVPNEIAVVDSKYIIEHIADDSKGILDIVANFEVDEIVVTVDNMRGSLPMKSLLDCKMGGVAVSDMRTFFEREKALVYLRNLTPSWFLFSDGFTRSGGLFITKRFFDILASSVLLLATWPVMLLAALAILLESGFGASVLYRQTRVGEGDQNFEVLKFRSMKVDAEMRGAQWAQENDDRITKVGHFIRKYRIDELPQIFNVFKGDMSFVGPRPERPEFVKQFTATIPFYNERHRVKPGITAGHSCVIPTALASMTHYKNCNMIYIMSKISASF